MKKIIKLCGIGLIMCALFSSCNTSPKENEEDLDNQEKYLPVDVSGKSFYSTWASSQYEAESNNQPPMKLSGNSIRQIVHASVGGDVIRVKFSNLVGNGVMKINEAHIALTKSGSEIVKNSDKLITFNEGKKSVSISAGQEIWSDALDFSFKDLDCLTVTIYFDSVPSKITGHMGSRTNSYMMTGKHLTDAKFDTNNKCEHWYVLAGIDVASDSKYKIVSCLGDSITDGRGTTTDLQNRWTDVLSERLLKNEGTKNVAVINEGIGGTLVSSSGVNRFDRDVLGNSGVYYAVLLYGVNDLIYANMQSSQLIDVYKRMIKKAHSNNVIIYGATILPFGNNNDYSDSKNNTRLAVNEWIKNTKPEDGGFDGFIDLASIMADPADSNKMKKAYDCGDGLHPNPDGYKAIGNAFDLALFTITTDEACAKWPSSNGGVQVQNVEFFKYKLPVSVPANGTVSFEFSGVNNGTRGFRIWLTDGSGSDFSNVIKYEKTGDFTIKDTLTAKKDVQYFFIKGIQYGVNIEDLTVKSCSVTINGTKTDIDVADYM